MKHLKLFSADKKQRNKSGRFEVAPYPPETHYPVIRSSICTGEKVAGFKEIKGGHFTEIMLIRSAKDVEEFKRIYHVDEIRTEY